MVYTKLIIILNTSDVRAISKKRIIIINFAYSTVLWNLNPQKAMTQNVHIVLKRTEIFKFSVLFVRHCNLKIKIPVTGFSHLFMIFKRENLAFRSNLLFYKNHRACHNFLYTIICGLLSSFRNKRRMPLFLLWFCIRFEITMLLLYDIRIRAGHINQKDRVVRSLIATIS